jgi:hypothetical protein
MDFSMALIHLRSGKRIGRDGWNGRGMFVWLNPGSADLETRNEAIEEYDALIGGVGIALFELGDDNTVTRMPNLNMRAADGSTITGWLASQSDMLAEDWEIVS